MTAVRRILFLIFVAFPGFAAGAETYLLMAEEPGCVWCERWNRDISGIYPKTPEGCIAPLRRFDLREGVPAGVSVVRDIRFTPTFVLVHDGAELGRIEGYPGEDFFWGLLGQMLRDNGFRVTRPDRHAVCRKSANPTVPDVTGWWN